MRTFTFALILVSALGASAQSPITPALGPRIEHKTIRPLVRATRHSLAIRYIKSTQVSKSRRATRAYQPARFVAVAQPVAIVAPVALVATAPTPAPFAENPIVGLRGNARAILVFAPDTTNPALLNQFALLERNELALSERDAVLVPIIAHHHSSDEAFPGENINPGNDSDQLAARLKFGINSNDFTIILLDKDGVVQLRSSTPVTVASLGARIDGFKDNFKDNFKDRFAGPGE